MQRSGEEASEGLTLWGRLSSCNVQKAVWALEELALPYRRIDAGGDFGGLDDPAYLAMNPNGRVPTLRDGNVVVWESDAIVRYVCARYGTGENGGVQLWHDDPARRAVVDQWMAWTASSLYRDWIDLFWRLVRTPESKRDAVTIARHHQATTARFAFLDRHLATNRYLAGDQLSMADLSAGITLYRWFEMDIERPEMPHVEAWYDRLRERPAYQSAVCVPFDDLIGKQGY